MASQDLIASSFKMGWSYGSLVQNGNIYVDRPQKPNQLAGFPYISMNITQDSYEVRSQQSYQDAIAIVGYSIKIEAYTCQGMTGGATTGDQVTDQGNIQRAIDAVLTKIPPDQPWFNVPLFLHCIKQPHSTMWKDRELYEGCDVFKSTQSYGILLLE